MGTIRSVRHPRRHAGDAILDDLAVLSKKGIRHKECTP